MTNPNLKKKFGIVILLDALGASQYSNEKIRKFLSARTKLNQILASQANAFKDLTPKKVKVPVPAIYTFGDTLIVVCELRSKKHINKHISMMLMLLQNYLFHSMEEGILFRGSYSIGSFVDDEGTNTVMGEAITDAASWYEKADWIGLSSTPKTNNVLEFYFQNDSFLNNPLFCINYPVPIEGGREIDLYTVSWAGRFFQGGLSNPEKRFLEVIKDQPIPLGVESKYINSKKYFYHVARLLKANKSLQPTAESGC